MEEDALKSEATSEVEDVVPELGTRLLHLQQERARCIKYAAALSGWSLFWTISLIAVGALVAAQGAFAKVWGNTSWLTITFVAFGVFTAAGTGFNSFFKPGERSPKFAEVGFEYERVEKNIRREAAALYRTMDPNIPNQRVGRQARMLLLRGRCNTGYLRPGEAAVVLNSKGQVTIPAHLRAKYGLHAGDEVEVVEAGGTLQIVRTEGAESRGQRLVRRLRNTATGRDITGLSTDQIMALLRAE